MMEAIYAGTLPGDPAADRQDALTWKPLRLLSFYRVILAGLLLALFYLAPGNSILGNRNPELFGASAIIYFLFAIGSGFAARTELPGYVIQVLTSVSADILVLVTFIHASGGLDSGLGILLVLTVAAGSLLMPGRMPFFFASLAAVALLAEVGYSTLLRSSSEVTDLSRTGLVGIALFTTALLAYLLARRIRDTETLARQRGVDLANLTQLNEHVVQHLDFGILVVDENGKIRLSNDMSWTLLNRRVAPANSALAAVSPELQVLLEHWHDGEYDPAAVFTPHGTGNSIIPRFTTLDTAPNAATIIFLENSATIEHRVQQMKLAAIGRLTASIAHEIRNPLGAISHASQLLDESPNLSDNERRLTEIIGDHTRRVNEVIENVLQLSRRRPANQQDIELGQWLQNFIDEFTANEGVPREQIPVNVEQPAMHVQFDSGHLHQVVWNLVRNAVVYGRSGNEPAQVRISAETEPGGSSCLVVQDQGPGIDPETAAKIFEPFFTTSTKGTGLGLYLARELCEYNQARLDYDPDGDGSRFVIVFPHMKETTSS